MWGVQRGNRINHVWRMGRAADMRCLCNAADVRGLPPRARHADLFEDVFLAVFFGLVDLGVDVTKHRCDDLESGCVMAAAASDGGRQVWQSRVM